MIVVNTGVLLGAADADDQDHRRCSALLRAQRGELKVPAPVVVETDWQIERNLGPAAEARFLRLITAGQREVVDLSVADYGRCAELIERYAGLRLGLVEASVVTVGDAENRRRRHVEPPRLQGGPPTPRRRLRPSALKDRPLPMARRGLGVGPVVAVAVGLGARPSLRRVRY